jgi:hypothetical protein
MWHCISAVWANEPNPARAEPAHYAAEAADQNIPAFTLDEPLKNVHYSVSHYTVTV